MQFRGHHGGRSGYHVSAFHCRNDYRGCNRINNLWNLGDTIDDNVEFSDHLGADDSDLLALDGSGGRVDLGNDLFYTIPERHWQCREQQL